jgi:hypothetical protein
VAKGGNRSRPHTLGPWRGGVQEHDGRAEESKILRIPHFRSCGGISWHSRAVLVSEPDDLGYAVSHGLAASSPRRPSYPCGWMRRLSYEINGTVGDLIFGNS